MQLILKCIWINSKVSNYTRQQKITGCDKAPKVEEKKGENTIVLSFTKV